MNGAYQVIVHVVSALFRVVLWLVQVARRKRIAETQARMQRQLAEKQARDRADLQKQEAQHDLRRVHEEHIAAWKSGKKVRSRTARCYIVSVGSDSDR